MGERDYGYKGEGVKSRQLRDFCGGTLRDLVDFRKFEGVKSVISLYRYELHSKPEIWRSKVNGHWIGGLATRSARGTIPDNENGPLNVLQKSENAFDKDKRILIMLNCMTAAGRTNVGPAFLSWRPHNIWKK